MSGAAVGICLVAVAAVGGALYMDAASKDASKPVHVLVNKANDAVKAMVAAHAKVQREYNKLERAKKAYLENEVVVFSNAKYVSSSNQFHDAVDALRGLEDLRVSAGGHPRNFDDYTRDVDGMDRLVRVIIASINNANTQANARGKTARHK